MRRLSILIGVLGAIVFISRGDSVSGQGSPCGMQLNTANVTFCDTFDTAYPDTTSRTGDLDANVWGVSRTVGQQNGPNPWPTSTHTGCGLNTTAAPPNDVSICNGRLIDAVNDAHNVIVLAMYPKQPFDFAGRTGTVSFDVTNDTQSSHAAWPEFWVTDLPIPAPFSHFGSWISNPRHGFGIRLESAVKPGEFGLCPNGNNLNKWRWTVDTAIVIRNYVYEDTAAEGLGSTPSSPPLSVSILDCVAEPDPVEPQGSSLGAMNHVEVRIAQNLIEVWASDAGSTTLRHIANVNNPNLSFSRGLVWIEDVHYNASKGLCHQDDGSNPDLPDCQIDHTFGWDNVAFDGPFVYRDFSYDAKDGTSAGPAWPDGSPSTFLGQSAAANASTSWDVLGMPPNPSAAAVRVLFNLYADMTAPSTITVTVNGHSHLQSWPYPDNLAGTWRTDAITIPITDLVAGTNVVTIGADQPITASNVNIVLVDVPGGVPVMPGSNNAYPHPVPVPAAPTSLRRIG